MSRSAERLAKKEMALELLSERLSAYPDEDWSGITDPKTRRRLQNRLNQRSRRLKNKGSIDPSKGKRTKGSESNSLPSHESAKNNQLRVETLPSHHDAAMDLASLAEITNIHILSPNSQSTKNKMALLEKIALQYYTMGSPRTDLLLNLITLNFTKALMENKRILGLRPNDLHDDAISPFNTAGPRQDTCLETLPKSLQPTLIQRSIPHHPWLDLLPIPQMRDNLILAGEFEEEEQLCLDMKGSGAPQPGNGIIVWSDPWDPAGWEVTAPFACSWGWVLKGCLDLAVSTNRWRVQRNEKPLFRIS